MDSFLKPAALTNPQRVRGFIFDLAVLSSNIFFIGSFLESAEDLPDLTIGILLTVAVVTQLLGATLKTSPLHYRLSQQDSRSESDWLDKFMGVLIFFHFILFTVIAMMALGLLGVVEVAGESTFSGDSIWAGLSILIGFLTAYIVWRAGKRPDRDQLAPGEYAVIKETIADGLLWISVTIITRFFWESWYSEIEPSRGIGLSGVGVVLLVALSLLFIVFYLPGRYLYIVEDYRYPGTWVRMWIAMLPMAWFILVG